MSSEIISWDRKDSIHRRPQRSRARDHPFTSDAFKQTMGRSQKKLPSLRGKQVLNLFLEPCPRTRVAFETAATRLTQMSWTCRAPLAAL